MTVQLTGFNTFRAELTSQGKEEKRKKERRKKGKKEEKGEKGQIVEGKGERRK